jgi:hypothetical protein
MVGAQEIEDALIRFDGRRVAALRLSGGAGHVAGWDRRPDRGLAGPREVGASWMLKALGK